MSPVVGRAPLVLSLALANLGRLAGRPAAGLPRVPQSGRIVSVVPDDGALLVDTDRGPVLLLVAWDAAIRGPRDLLGLDDVRMGDVVEWTDEGGQTVAMIDELRVVPSGAR